MSVPRVVRDGKVAVLVSPDFGAGWSSWNSDHREAFLFHAKLVEAVEAGRLDDLADEDFVKDAIGAKDYVCCLGARDLQVRWLPLGTPFQIHEYDGSESIDLLTDVMTATAGDE